MEQWCWVDFQCRGVLLIWIVVGQGPTVLAVGTGGGLFGHFFSGLLFLSSYSLSLGDCPIQTEILSQRAVKPKSTNQATVSRMTTNNYFIPMKFCYNTSFTLLTQCQRSRSVL